MTWFIDLRVDDEGGSPVFNENEVMVYQAPPYPCQQWGDQNCTKGVVPSALVDAMRGRNVLFGVHGFNVDRKSGTDNLSAWASRLDLQGGLFIGILWPGDLGDGLWIPGASIPGYIFDGDAAMTSARILASFMLKDAGQPFSVASSLSFVSHSLGARVVLETIRNLTALQPAPPPLRVREVTLMAGAIDDNCLSKEYKDTAQQIGKISVLASYGDWVLGGAFPIGNPLASIFTRGHPYWKGALGYWGPDPNHAPANLVPGWRIPDDWDYGHLDYLDPGKLVPPSVAIDLVPCGQVDCSEPHLDDLPANSQSAWSAGFVSTRFR